MNVTLATPANMEAARIRAREPISAKGLFAWSEFTGERYSASPGDYWNRPQDKPLLDSEGNPMVLATEQTAEPILRCGFCYDRENGKRGEVKREWSWEWLQFIPVCRLHACADGMDAGPKQPEQEV